MLLTDADMEEEMKANEFAYTDEDRVSITLKVVRKKEVAKQ
jgi:hypothetical protein